MPPSRPDFWLKTSAPVVRWPRRLRAAVTLIALLAVLAAALLATLPAWAQSQPLPASPEAPITVSARNFIVDNGVTVHGAVWAHEIGIVKAA